MGRPYATRVQGALHHGTVCPFVSITRMAEALPLSTMKMAHVVLKLSRFPFLRASGIKYALLTNTQRESG